MPANSTPLSSLRIDKPCSQNWESMPGDERRRFCAQCQHHVHNLSALTQREIQKLIVTTEGRLCGRLERDSFGRLKTRSEKTGLLDGLTKRARTTKLALSSILAALAANIGFAQSPANSTSTANAAETPPSQPPAGGDKKKPTSSPPSSPPVVEKESETIELLWMGIIACEKKPPLKKKYKK
jgi:hypothetical protein